MFSLSSAQEMIESKEGVVKTSDLWPTQTEVVGNLWTYYLRLALMWG